MVVKTWKIFTRRLASIDANLLLSSIKMHGDVVSKTKLFNEVPSMLCIKLRVLNNNVLEHCQYFYGSFFWCQEK